MKYFIIGIHPETKKPVPIMSNEEIALFDTIQEAKELTLEQPLCRSGGYRIIGWEHLK